MSNYCRNTASLDLLTLLYHLLEFLLPVKPESRVWQNVRRWAMGLD